MIFQVKKELEMVSTGALIVLVCPTHLMIEVVPAPICAFPSCSLSGAAG